MGDPGQGDSGIRQPPFPEATTELPFPEVPPPIPEAPVESDPSTLVATTVALPAPPSMPADGGGPRRRGGRKALLVVVALALVGTGVAIPLVLTNSGSTGNGTTSPPHTQPPLPLLPPEGFAGLAEPFTVNLTWSVAPSSATVTEFELSRDGILLAHVPGATTTYSDLGLKPGKTYSYALLSHGEAETTSSPVTIEVKTPVPALSKGRLDGAFNVKLKPTSQFGYIGTIKSSTLGWDFTPKCAEGPCNTTLKDLFYKGFKVTLVRKGVDYSAVDTAKFGGTCSGVVGTSTLTVKFHVTKARGVGGVWQAVSFVGTLVERHPSVLGCVSGGADYKVTGTFVSN